MQGFAFVTFESEKDADAAREALNNLKFEYSVLKVEWARKT